MSSAGSRPAEEEVGQKPDSKSESEHHRCIRDSNDSSSKARVQSKQTNYLVIEWQTFEVLQLLVQLLLADLAVAFEGVDHTEKVDALLAQLFLQTVPVGVVLIAMIDWLRGRRRLRVEHIRAVHRGVHPAAEFPE